MKTLIVEDDSISRLILETTLKTLGSTTSLTTGRNAAAQVSQAWNAGEPFDLVTLDIMMPEVDGQTALRQIREAEVVCGVAPARRSKIIMTTALDDQKNIVAAQEGTCDGYLVKPIRTTALLALVKKLGLV